MVTRVEGGFLKLVDHALGRGVGGVTHPQVDDVDPGDALLVFHLVDATEQVWRQTADAGRDVDFKGLLAHGMSRL